MKNNMNIRNHHIRFLADVTNKAFVFNYLATAGSVNFFNFFNSFNSFNFPKKPYLCIIINKPLYLRNAFFRYKIFRLQIS